MRASRWSSALAVLAGAAWVVAALLGWGADPDPTVVLVGLGLLVLALLLAGYALVAAAPLWLRAVVSLATPALGAMVWLSLVDAWGSGDSGDVLVLAAGAFLVLAGLVGLVRALGRTRPEAPAPVPGRRAAR